MTDALTFDELKASDGDVLVSRMWADGEPRDPERYVVTNAARRWVRSLNSGIAYTIPGPDDRGVPALYSMEP